MGRALQPSIIYIDECEKMFKKKTPKGDTVSTRAFRTKLKSCIAKLII